MINIHIIIVAVSLVLLSTLHGCSSAEEECTLVSNGRGLRFKLTDGILLPTEYTCSFRADIWKPLSDDAKKAAKAVEPSKTCGEVFAEPRATAWKTFVHALCIPDQAMSKLTRGISSLTDKAFDKKKLRAH